MLRFHTTDDSLAVCSRPHDPADPAHADPAHFGPDPSDPCLFSQAELRRMVMELMG